MVALTVEYGKNSGYGRLSPYKDLELYSGKSDYTLKSKGPILHFYWKPTAVQPDQTIHLVFQACPRYISAFTNVILTAGMSSFSITLHPAFKIQLKIHFPETAPATEILPFSKTIALLIVSLPCI